MADKDAENNQNRTSSAVELHIDINTLDTNYTFLKVGVVRFYSHNSDFQQADTWEIVNNYIISDIIALNGVLTINGEEGEVLLSSDEELNETFT